MGKRSNFERIPRDFYRTPYAAVPPLIPYLHGIRTFAEPCAGDGALVRHLEPFGLRCVYAGDISEGQDALARDHYNAADAILTNPPYTRLVMHALIKHFQRIAPTWLLIDHDWLATKQAAEYLPHCSDIVALARLKWFEGSKDTGKDNHSWYRFDSRHRGGPIFHNDRGQGVVIPSGRTGACEPCDKPEQMHGRLCEGILLTGFTLERAFDDLQWLLAEDRWRLGDRYNNVNEFLASIRLDQFRILADQRKRLAVRIKELQPEASNRTIAKMVGAGRATINRDVAGSNEPLPNGHETIEPDRKSVV